MQYQTLYKNISVFILLFINFIFSYKYLLRETEYSLIISLILVFLGFLLLKNPFSLTLKGKSLEIALLSVFGIISFFIWKKIPVETLNVDRWSVITSFWDTYFSNNYAYSAKSHMENPPGPMPFYFILTLPFYLIKELGYLSVLGVIFFYILMIFNKINPKKRLFVLLFILSSLSTVWEVACRSNVFFNSSLILATTLFILHQIKLNRVSIFTTAIVVGLTLSTRNVFIIPYIIVFLFFLKSKKLSFQQFFSIGILSVLVFFITFVPFIYKYWNEFLETNPFIIQSTFLIPFEYTILFIALAIGSIWLIKSDKEIIFYSGFVLFISIFIYMLYHILKSGFQEAILGNIIDLSYFILCIPFLLWYYIQE